MGKISDGEIDEFIITLLNAKTVQFLSDEVILKFGERALELGGENVCQEFILRVKEKLLEISTDSKKNINEVFAVTGVLLFGHIFIEILD